MSDLFLTREVAKQLGVSERRVRALAKDRKVGTQLSDGTWVFTAADVKNLAPNPPGRPSGGEKSPLTKAEFESYLRKAAEPVRPEQHDQEEVRTSESQTSDGCNESRTHQDSAEGT